MTSSGDAVLRQNKLRPVLLWCSPSLLGFALFLVSFPIYRVIPFWPRLSLAEIFLYWFVFITPVTTLIGTVILIKRRRRVATLPKVMAWFTITVSVLANLFVILGMIG
ncbi:MAG TPA: hypothetical protein VKR60_14295 [Candidatus Sulfotelmatobacter sp.]|nr:hypothetical protein [Candidatus Sulfotelmatobacter sp.]